MKYFVDLLTCFLRKLLHPGHRRHRRRRWARLRLTHPGAAVWRRVRGWHRRRWARLRLTHPGAAVWGRVRGWYRRSWGFQAGQRGHNGAQGAVDFLRIEAGGRAVRRPGSRGRCCASISIMVSRRPSRACREAWTESRNGGVEAGGRGPKTFIPTTTARSIAPLCHRRSFHSIPDFPHPCAAVGGRSLPSPRWPLRPPCLRPTPQAPPDGSLTESSQRRPVVSTACDRDPGKRSGVRAVRYGAAENACGPALLGMGLGRVSLPTRYAPAPHLDSPDVRFLHASAPRPREPPIARPWPACALSGGLDNAARSGQAR